MLEDLVAGLDALLELLGLLGLGRDVGAQLLERVELGGELGEVVVQLGELTDLDGLDGDGALGVLALAVATGERGSVGGTRTIAVSGDGGAGGTLDVSLEGTAYPLRLTRAGDAGELRMRDWNEKFTLKAPAEDEMVDYGRELPSD